MTAQARNSKPQQHIDKNAKKVKLQKKQKNITCTMTAQASSPKNHSTTFKTQKKVQSLPLNVLKFVFPFHLKLASDH